MFGCYIIGIVDDAVRFNGITNAVLLSPDGKRCECSFIKGIFYVVRKIQFEQKSVHREIADIGMLHHDDIGSLAGSRIVYEIIGRIEKATPVHDLNLHTRLCRPLRCDCADNIIFPR